MRRISLLGWLIMAILLIDAGLDLLARDGWGATRSLIIVALLPQIFSSPKRAEGPPPTS